MKATRSFERVALPDRVVTFDVVQHLGVQDEEAGVDPAGGGLWLLSEANDLVAFKLDIPEARRRMGGCDRRQSAMAMVKGDQRADVHVGEAIAIGHHKAVIAEPGLEPQQPATGHRGQAGVHQMHRPIMAQAVVHGDLAGIELDGNAAVERIIVQKVLFDHLAFVAEGDDELFKAVGGIPVHDVHEDRFTTYFNHGLGAHGCFFGQAGAHPTRK